MMTANTPCSINKTTAMQARTHLRSTIGTASSVRDISRVNCCSQGVLVPAQTTPHRLTPGYAWPSSKANDQKWSYQAHQQVLLSSADTWKCLVGTHVNPRQWQALQAPGRTDATPTAGAWR